VVGVLVTGGGVVVEGVVGVVVAGGVVVTIDGEEEVARVVDEAVVGVEVVTLVRV